MPERAGLFYLHPAEGPNIFTEFLKKKNIVLLEQKFKDVHIDAN